PLYNNAGETISYSVNEVNIPEGFDFSLNQENNHFTLINTYKETRTSTTESSSSESTSQSSTSDSNSSESSTTVVTSTESTVAETSESSRKPAVIKTTSASGKSYPYTNDERASKIWMLIGTSLLGASLYLLKKFN
ncbi:MAG: peptidase, partial [Enterococcus hulanensis]